MGPGRALPTQGAVKDVSTRQAAVILPEHAELGGSARGMYARQQRHQVFARHHHRPKLAWPRVKVRGVVAKRVTCACRRSHGKGHGSAGRGVAAFSRAPSQQAPCLGLQPCTLAGIWRRGQGEACGAGKVVTRAWRRRRSS